MKLPEDARKLQNLQHVIGGTYNILLVLVGVSFGKNETHIGILIAIITFLISRLSSEINYQISVRVVREHSHR